ncbi:YbaB/EbfC family nucleoid-associated protein [Nocardia africana]|uniref:YbaB/EbfC family nucleoid-associated protein n=1 Tax=Nocardia africana TaxID=134964 RepID=A0ABW6NSU8_9NOCA
MDRWERDELRAGNSGLRNQVDHLLDAFEQQRDRLAQVYRQLEDARVQADSPDRTVEVTVDVNGLLTELRLSAAALRGGPEKLASTIVATVRAAAEQARRQHESLTAPIAAELDDLGDLPDVMSEAPSLRDTRARFRNEGPAAIE